MTCKHQCEAMKRCTDDPTVLKTLIEHAEKQGNN